MYHLGGFHIKQILKFPFQHQSIPGPIQKLTTFNQNIQVHWFHITIHSIWIFYLKVWYHWMLNGVASVIRLCQFIGYDETNFIWNIQNLADATLYDLNQSIWINDAISSPIKYGLLCINWPSGIIDTWCGYHWRLLW